LVVLYGRNTRLSEVALEAFLLLSVIHVEKSVIHVNFPTKRRKKCMMLYEN